MKLLYWLLVGIGFIGFLSLYILVCIFTEENYPLIQYIVPVIGYISIIIFGYGWFNILKKDRNK